jgi:hypothetical protein
LRVRLQCRNCAELRERDIGTRLALCTRMASMRSRVAALAVWMNGVAALAEPALERWLPLEAPAGVDRAAEALAVDPSSGRIAVGGERGVALGEPGAPLERVLTRGPVHDLLFERDGALLAATEVGLFRIERADQVRVERVGTGDAARQVRALAMSGNAVVAATGAGVFERTASEPSVWRRVPGLPFGEARRAAIVNRADGKPEVWAAIDGALWTASEEQGGRRVTLPGAAQGEEGPVDLASTASGDLLVVLRRSLAVRSATGTWRVEPLVLPPGALPVRIAADAGGLWLATDAGLLHAPGPAGPWQRVGGPAGSTAVAAVAGARDRLVVATAQGLLRRAAVSEPPSGATSPRPAPAPARALRGDPPITAVQRRALQYVSLDPRRMHQLWDAAGRRAWAPEVVVRGDYGEDTDRARSWDETFVSGDTHSLFDRDRKRADGYSVSLGLSWDLGDAVFNLDRIDVSREARLVIQLRDDVLDEVNQIYFERQRVLASLDAPPADVPVALLRLRAAELASGLDAWTGGWFSEQLVHPDSDGPSFPAQESSP